MIKQLPRGRCPPAPGDPFGTDRDQHQPGVTTTGGALRVIDPTLRTVNGRGVVQSCASDEKPLSWNR